MQHTHAQSKISQAAQRRAMLCKRALMLRCTNHRARDVLHAMKGVLAYFPGFLSHTSVAPVYSERERVFR